LQVCADVSSAPRARPVFLVPHHVLLFAHRTLIRVFTAPWPRGGACSCHMVYHSAVPSQGEQHACGFALLPLNTKTRGPAKRTEGATRDAGTPLCAHPCVAEQQGAFRPLSESFCGAGEDVVDEALTYFRANVLYRKFEVQGARDEGCLQLSGAVCWLCTEPQLWRVRTARLQRQDSHLPDAVHKHVPTQAGIGEQPGSCAEGARALWQPSLLGVILCCSRHTLGTRTGALHTCSGAVLYSRGCTVAAWRLVFAAGYKRGGWCVDLLSHRIASHRIVASECTCCMSSHFRCVARVLEAGAGRGGSATRGEVLHSRGSAKQVVDGLLKAQIHERGVEMMSIINRCKGVNYWLRHVIAGRRRNAHESHVVHHR